MAILPEAEFNYAFRLRRGADAVWRGMATAATDEPQLVGAAPNVALTISVLSFVASEPLQPRPDNGLVKTYPMTSRYAIGVGEALEAILQDDDHIQVERDAMGAEGLIVSCDNDKERTPR